MVGEKIPRPSFLKYKVMSPDVLSSLSDIPEAKDFLVVITLVKENPHI